MDEKLTKKLILKFTNQPKPSKGEVLSKLNDDLEINLLRLIETKSAFIALCHSQDDAVKLNSREGKDTVTNLGLSLANSPALEARKAIVAKNFDDWITCHSPEEIQAEFNSRYPNTECTKVIIMGRNKNLMKLIFSDTEEAKSIADNGFSVFHVRVPPYNINIDEFVDVPLCMKCYKLNDHQTRHCTLTVIICSDCSVIGHHWKDCTSTNKRCINCDGGHKTTAPQCPKRKEEANKIRKQAAQKQNSGLSYSSAVKSNMPSMQNFNISNDSALKIMTAVIHAHTMNAINPGSYNTAMNQILTANNLPNMVFPDNPPSRKFLNLQLQQTNNDKEADNQAIAQTTQSIPTNQEEEESPVRKRKKRDPREHTSKKIGLSIIFEPGTKFNRPNSATRQLPRNKNYMFTFTNNEYSREEIEKLLQNNNILIDPEDIYPHENEVHTLAVNTHRNQHLSHIQQN